MTKRRRPYDPIARRRRTLAAYGLTEAQYQAMLRRQRGLCDICALPMGRRPYVDHDHKGSRRVRGLLCFRCNHRLLGRGLEDAKLHRAAAEYLLSAFDGRKIRPEDWA